MVKLAGGAALAAGIAHGVDVEGGGGRTEGWAVWGRYGRVVNSVGWASGFGDDAHVGGLAGGRTLAVAARLTGMCCPCGAGGGAGHLLEGHTWILWYWCVLLMTFSARMLKQ